MQIDADGAMIAYISNILNMVGITANLVGYIYLRESVYQKINNGSYIFKDLLKINAEKYQNKSNNINSSIKHALTLAWKDGKVLRLNEFFGVQTFSADRKMSNYMFISTLTDLITLKNNITK